MVMANLIIKIKHSIVLCSAFDANKYESEVKCIVFYRFFHEVDAFVIIIIIANLEQVHTLLHYIGTLKWSVVLID